MNIFYYIFNIIHKPFQTSLVVLLFVIVLFASSFPRVLQEKGKGRQEGRRSVQESSATTRTREFLVKSSTASKCQQDCEV